MNKLIDMHFHLDFYANHKQIYKKINDMEQHTLCVTNQPEIFESCIELYKPTKYIQFAVGYHPQNVGKVPFEKRTFINNLVKTKYVGEVGLDFSKEFSGSKNKQIEIFDFICEASVDKIMSIHCRMAEEKTYEILKRNRNHKMIMHWYSGNEEWLEKLIDLGAYFSINSNMLASAKGSNIIGKIPIDKLFVESDGPFTKLRGKKFTVEMLESIYEELASIRNLVNVECLKKQIASNYVALINTDIN
jgi:TatD DNase family protein